jgi:hypothetical protein
VLYLLGIHCHIGDMATYTVTAEASGTGFQVGIVGTNGTKQTMCGFSTEAEAEAWITSDRALDAGWVNTKWGAAD